jgi:hypothetical protein
MRTTTIKVPVELRDRLAARAEQEHTTLAEAIRRSLDAAEDAAFWSGVAATMGQPIATATPRATTPQAAAEELRGSLADGLDPTETWDDVW